MFFISKREISQGEALINASKNVNIFGSSYDQNEYSLIFENAKSSKGRTIRFLRWTRSKSSHGQKSPFTGKLSCSHWEARERRKAHSWVPHPRQDGSKGHAHTQHAQTQHASQSPGATVKTQMSGSHPESQLRIPVFNTFPGDRSCCPGATLWEPLF